MDGTNCSNMGGVKEHWTFFYDGDGVRVKETHTDFETSPTTITTRLFLFGGTYEINDDGGASESVTKYYSLAGMRVAMREGTDVSYFAADHLSSSSVVMDDTGTLLSQNRYRVNAKRSLRVIGEANYTPRGGA